jgi:hypothetical protein
MTIRHLRNSTGDLITEALYHFGGSNRCARMFGWLTEDQVRDALSRSRRLAAA